MKRGRAAKGTSSGLEVNAGDVVAIPFPNGRFAAIWIVDRTDDFDHKSFFVLDGYWDSAPAKIARPAIAKYPNPGLLPDKDDSWTGAVFGAVPDDFIVVGRAAITKAVRARHAKSGSSVFQDGEHLRRSLYDHWRRLHDREAYEAEREAALERAERERTRKLDERKANNSLPNMRREKPFAHWRARWGPSVVRKVQASFGTATEALIALGPRASASKKTAVFDKLVVALNVLYDKTGCIETVEREELVARIEELGGLVGLDNDGERLTGKRDW